MARPLALIGFSFLLALCAANVLGVSFACVALIGSILLLAFCLIFRKCRQARFLPPVCLAAAAACLLFIGCMEWSYLPSVALAGDRVPVTVQLTGQPEEKDGRYHYTARTVSVDGSTCRVNLTFSSGQRLDAQPYDIISGEMNLYVPGGTDASITRQYRAKNIFLSGYTVSGVSVEPQGGYLLERGLIQMRSWIKAALLDLLPGDPGAVLVSMLLGSSGGMSREVTDNFRIAGVSHLFAVSGLHLSIWALLVQRLLLRARLSQRTAALAAAGFVIFFMALAGFTFSVMRAGIMMLVYLSGFLFRREPDSINSLGFAALVISFLSPFAVLDAGFLLSFCATLGVLLLSNPFITRLRNPAQRIAWKPAKMLAFACAEILGVTLSAILFTLPVNVMVFGCVSLIAPLGNLLLVSAAQAAMILAGVAVILRATWIFAFLQYPFALVSGLLAKYLLGVANGLAQIPNAVADAQGAYWVLWIAGTLLLVALAVVLTKKGNTFYKLTALLSVILLLVGTASFRLYNSNSMVLTVADVGNGMSVLLSEKGRGVLIGCGGDYAAASQIQNAIQVHGVETLDFCLIPRENDTESNALEVIAKQYPAQEYFVPDGSTFSFLQEQSRVRVAGPEAITFWKGYTLETMQGGGYSCALLTARGFRILFVFYPASAVPAAWRNPDLLVCRQAPSKGVQAGFTLLSGEGSRAITLAGAQNTDGFRCAATGGYGNLSIRFKENRELRIGRDR